MLLTRPIYDEKELPELVQKCVETIKNDNEEFIDDFRVNFQFHTRPDMVIFNLDKEYLSLEHVKAWAMMKLYYGFDVKYSDGLFKIGGYETDEVTAKTLSALIKKLEKLCK